MSGWDLEGVRLYEAKVGVPVGQVLDRAIPMNFRTERVELRWQDVYFDFRLAFLDRPNLRISTRTRATGIVLVLTEGEMVYTVVVPRLVSPRAQEVSMRQTIAYARLALGIDPWRVIP